MQEITASAQVQFGCGKETIGFRELQEAIYRLEKSSHWRLENDTACCYFRKITKIHRRRHKAGALSLCDALLETQDFLSKEVNDRLFAIVGIGYDGSDLVPSTDYRQSLNNVARDLTRSLIRRNGCFDIIVADQSRKSRPDGFPTWVLNWFSGDLPNDEYFISCMRPGSGPLF